jgi:hypothetical protein
MWVRIASDAISEQPIAWNHFALPTPGSTTTVLRCFSRVRVGACVFLCRVCVGVNGARRRTCSLRSLSTWPLNLCGRSPIDVEDEAAAAVSFVAYVSSGSWELCVGSNKLP